MKFNTVILFVLAFSVCAGTAFGAAEDAPKTHMEGMMGMRMQHMQMETIAARGVVNSLDIAHKIINISHEPIKNLGWPAMTMDFHVVNAKVLQGVKAGMTIDFRFEDKGPGKYMITKIQPVSK